MVSRLVSVDPQKGGLYVSSSSFKRICPVADSICSYYCIEPTYLKEPIMAIVMVVIVAVAVVVGGSVQASHHSSQILGAYIITNTPTKTMAAPTQSRRSGTTLSILHPQRMERMMKTPP